MIPVNINVNIVNIIITRLDVPVKADDTEEEEDDASSSSVLKLLFKKRVLKLSLKVLLLFEPCLVKRRSDRRSSSSFIVFRLSRRVTNFPENVDTFCAENSDVKEGVHERRVSR